MDKLNIIKKIFGKSNDDDEPHLEDLFKKGQINITEYGKKMIYNIIQLENITVKEIMVPRVDVISIDIQSGLDNIIKVVTDQGHSRLPVYDKNIDNIVGILHTKDLIKNLNNNNHFDIKKLIREPFFVPETKIINDLLVELREKKIHLAIVVDEYGGMSGIVCLEDIIEKIVGEIQDEFDNDVEDVVKIDENIYLINPRISLEELNERIGTKFDEEEIDTFGGLVYMYFGKIPLKNEKIQRDNYIFTIEAISGRKIKLIKLEILTEE